MENIINQRKTDSRPQEADEILETIWTLREQGRNRPLDLFQAIHLDDVEKRMSTLKNDGLLLVDDEKIKLTIKGEEVAEQIIRRHRLAERLFADVFHTTEEVWEREACELEHQAVLVEEAVNAVCSFLGHPSTCPHGKPIPRGSCCAKFKREITPFVIPLSEALIAQPYRIVFITPKESTRLDRLAVLGILPGGKITLHQKRPSFVIRSGETDVAMDRDVVRDIYVKRISS